MKIEFEASLPPIMGSRIKIDVSKQYNAEIVKLQELAGTSFKVVISEE